MQLPLINDRKVFEYEGEKVIVWQQDLFIKVYLRTVPEKGGSSYIDANWWKFMFKAKCIETLPERGSAY